FNLNISFPPPYNTRRQEWTWQDLLDDACEATERLNGTAGLLANSDFDEDFKFFTLMVQSGGGSLYQQEGEGDDQSLRCSINSPVGVNVLKNFWTAHHHSKVHDGPQRWTLLGRRLPSERGTEGLTADEVPQRGPSTEHDQLLQLHLHGPQSATGAHRRLRLVFRLR
ncbi:unnamed protein product, partial [Durusdinium trenchii]